MWGCIYVPRGGDTYIEFYNRKATVRIIVSIPSHTLDI